MEGVVAPDPAFWRGRAVLVTGHTGFKGSWLVRWLTRMDARVFGYALAPPTTPSLWADARLAETCVDKHGDVRDARALDDFLRECRPEIVLHLAAQPLVRASYEAPLETLATNVMGTAHLLEASRVAPSVRAVVIVTTDKVYDNREWLWGYRETDTLGGHDIYSASKACAELVTSSYRRALFASRPDVGLASARAGNVIGGGDWAADRLVPDLVRAFHRGEVCTIRNPTATRPWQHVLEPLAGYLLLAERLVGSPVTYAGAWNFGPRDEDARPVAHLAQAVASAWSGGGAHWQAMEEANAPHEAGYLHLDWTRARHELGWAPRWDLITAVHRSVGVYATLLREAEAEAVRAAMDDEIAAYLESA